MHVWSTNPSSLSSPSSSSLPLLYCTELSKIIYLYVCVYMFLTLRSTVYAFVYELEQGRRDCAGII